MSFEKFTDKRARCLSSLRMRRARFISPYVGTEHILLGLIQEKDGSPPRLSLA